MTNIELGQVEDTDAKTLKKFLNSKHARYLGFYKAFSDDSTRELIANLSNDNNSRVLSIKTTKKSNFKKIIRGLCFVEEIDWLSRHAKISIIKADEEKNLVGLGDCPDTRRAFELLIDFCFQELNLNKVWVEVVGKSNADEELLDLGFMSEGKRRYAHNIGGKQLNSSIYSLLKSEF